MLNKQPKVLRLADALENDLVGYDGMSIPRTCQDIADKAAAELRRLHAENAEQIGEIVALKEQRDELLAVLEEAEYALDYASDMTKPEGLSGCDCPICTASIRIGEVLAGKRRQA